MPSPFKLAPQKVKQTLRNENVYHIQTSGELEESYLPGEYESGKATNVFQKQIRKSNK